MRNLLSLNNLPDASPLPTTLAAEVVSIVGKSVRDKAISKGMPRGDQDSFSESDFVTVNDLSTDFRNEITDTFHNYATLLILNDDNAGSGIFVQIDGCFGILTAEHVVFSPINPFNNSVRSQQILSVPVEHHSLENLDDARIQPDVRRINVSSLSWYPDSPHSETYEAAEWGPILPLFASPPPRNSKKVSEREETFGISHWILRTVCDWP